MIGIFNILKDNINTNVQIGEIDDFINLAEEMQDAKTSSFVLDYGDAQNGRTGLLIEPARTADKGYQSVLIPRVGEQDFSEVQEYVKCIIEGLTCEIADKGIVKTIKN